MAQRPRHPLAVSLMQRLRVSGSAPIPLHSPSFSVGRGIGSAVRGATANAEAVRSALREDALVVCSLPLETPQLASRI
ncbi:MAG: hypothetical protein EHM35_09415 [Planctomycetaceae bacterium]|nr:MAG: hypothetical protein EHM35_09415 [Planctomycetaceae bacterium]